MPRLRPLAALAALSATLLAAGCTVSAHQAPTPAASPSTNAEAARVAPGKWASQRASTRTSPATLARGARAGSRVVTLSRNGSRPQLQTTTVSSATAATSVIAAAQADPATLAVSLDTPVHALAADPQRPNQWGLDRLRVSALAASAPGAAGTVAVIDTGVQGTHPDLAGLVAPGRDFTTVAGGRGDADPNGHGTHVAGIIAALAGNGRGGQGLTPGATILPLRVLDASGAGYDSNVAQAVIYAADAGADVINLSLGSPGSSDVLAGAIAYAHERGVVVVAAGGNARTSGSPVNYPAAYPFVIAVAATDRDDTDAPYSNIGSYLDLAAPGSSILSTYKNSDYMLMSGTSMASPFVAAAALAVTFTSPSLTPDQVQSALTSTASDLGPRGADTRYGAGLLDPAAAVAAGRALAASAEPMPTSDPAPTTPAPTTPAPLPSSSPSPTQPAPSPTRPVPDTPAPVPTPSLPSPPAPTRPPSTPPAPTTPPRTTPPPKTTPITPAKTTLTLRGAPRTVRAGTTITGTALLRTSAGTPVAGATVAFCTRIAPATRYSCRTLRTGAAGTVGYSVRATGHTLLYVAHAATSSTGASVSDAWRYPVTAAVTLRPGKGRITASATPATGQKMTLARRSGSRWVTLVSTKVRGTVIFTNVRKGTYRVSLASSSLAGASSATTVVR